MSNPGDGPSELLPGTKDTVAEDEAASVLL